MDMQGINPLEWLTSGLQSISGIGESAAANSAKGSSATGGIDFAKIIMDQVDSDRDGKISESEMNAGAQKLKDSLSQLNGISTKMRAHSVNSKSGVDSATLISALDANGNSTLDITESSLTQAAFAKIDTNGDGQLSSAELSALVDKANGGRSSTKIKATKEECVSILNELQARGAAKQYETSVASMSSKKAA